MATAAILIGVTVAAAVASGVMTAYAANQQAQATKKASQYQQAVAIQNENTSKYNARLAELEGAAEKEKKRKQIKIALGRARVNQAKSGIDLSGTAVDIQDDILNEGMSDLLAIDYNTSKRRFNFLQQGKGFHDSGVLAQHQGDSAVRAGKIAGATSIFNGVASGLSRLNSFSGGTGGGPDRAFAA